MAQEPGVDQFDPTPLHVQLSDILRAKIRSGELAPLAPLPSESALQETYGVSRGTVRHSLSTLREQGWVETLPQRATVVARKPPK